MLDRHYIPYRRDEYISVSTEIKKNSTKYRITEATGYTHNGKSQSRSL
jgi:hypothetical protein